jgi:uncharacterized membrane protein
MSKTRNWHAEHQSRLTWGEKLADSIAAGMGSWKFIIIQTLIVVLWMTLNTVAFVTHWDIYPFVLLNLVFSTQAAYAAPIIMMSQNRAAARDKVQAEHQYEHQEKELKLQTEILNEQTQILRELKERAS